MNSQSGDATQALVDIFPRIYYFFRCLSEHSSDIGGKLVKFDEPMDALLWFLELKGAKTEETACSKKELMNLVYRWYGATTTLQRSYKRLSSAGLIDSISGTKDARVKFVWLTSEGSAILKRFKKERYAEISVLWQSLKEIPAHDREKLVGYLSKMAGAACNRMLKDSKDEPFENAVKNKSRRIDNNGNRRSGHRK